MNKDTSSDEETLQEELYNLNGDKKDDRALVRMKPKKWRSEYDYDSLCSYNMWPAALI